MKYYLTLLFLLSFLIYSQESTSNEYNMNTALIIHVDDNRIYRLGIAEMLNDVFKKSVDGKDIAEITLSNKDKNIRCRGIYHKDEQFYVIKTEDNFDKTTITLSVLDENLKEIESKIIFTGATVGVHSKGEMFFEHNDNGFVLIRNYTNDSRRVILESYIYNTKEEKLHHSKLNFETNQKLKVLDFDFSNELQAALILDSDISTGTLKGKELKKLETYLIHLAPEKDITAKKLTEDKVHFDRSYNLAFHNEELVVAHLKFHNPSNILAGYVLKQYALNDSDELIEENSTYFEFSDYAEREEWGPIKEEVEKQYDKDKNGKGTRYESFGALEITDLYIENDEAILILRELFHQKVNDPAMSANSGMGGNNQHGNQMSKTPMQTNMTEKRFKEFQIAKLDLRSEEVLWWNRIYNTPITNGNEYSADLPHNRYFWNDKRINSRERVYYPYIDGDKIVLLYPTFKALYDENGELNNEVVNQRRTFNFSFTVYGLIGKSEINKESGEVKNSLLLEEIKGAGKATSVNILNINAFYVTEDSVIISSENGFKRSSELIVTEK
ncbi:MAG TPA: hypothetical protein VKY37_12275 [Brumimicrobium sp.]|nr:hypothetical protein [Brumimicrobium sp.]